MDRLNIIARVRAREDPPCHGLPYVAAVPPDLPSDDAAWDALYAGALATAAPLHFTDLATVYAASDWLVAAGGTRFVDLGSGTGKFVLAAAARHPDVAWWGVELRPELHAIAEEARVRYGIGNAHFSLADLRDFPLTGFAGAYVFNPFGELLDPRPDLGAGGLGERGTAAYRASRGALRQNLRRTPEGFRVTTYYCEEGQVPRGYERAWARVKLVGWVGVG